MPKIFGKIGPREKAWAVAWIGVVLMVGFFRFFYQPSNQAIREAVDGIEDLGKQKRSLQAKIPEFERRKAEIEVLKRDISNLYEGLLSSEQDLLNLQDVDQLLESLVKDRARFEMRLNSIRPIHVKEPSAAEASPGGAPKSSAEPYRKLNVQLDTFSTFHGLVEYIHFLERMRAYQQIEGIKVKVEGKEVSRPHAVLLVSVLMGDTQEKREADRREVFALLEEMAARERKDPFLTSDRPKELVQAVGLELTGIFSEGSRPVAVMINNEIYRVGQVVQGKRIVAIEGGQVLLEQGNQRFVLVPKQQGGGNQ